MGLWSDVVRDDGGSSSLPGGGRGGTFFDNRDQRGALSQDLEQGGQRYLQGGQ